MGNAQGALRAYSSPWRVKEGFPGEVTFKLSSVASPGILQDQPDEKQGGPAKEPRGTEKFIHSEGPLYMARSRLDRDHGESREL